MYTQLYNQSLAQDTLPDSWKASAIVPVPKKPSPSKLNDYRPVALTSVVMKCMKRVVLQNLISMTATHTDSHQFAYKKARGTDDACALLTHLFFSHTDNSANHTRIVCVDFSSEFNTMLPSVLIQKVCSMQVWPTILRWILSYRIGRTQKVRVGSMLSGGSMLSVPLGPTLEPHSDEYSPRYYSPYSLYIHGQSQS